MKTIIFIAALVLGSLASQTAHAQVSVNINIGSQPVWGPVGYDHVDYYYMPDIDAYYYVPNRQYIYFQRGSWQFSSSLPARYNYDIYSGYKVVINQPKPYFHADKYRIKYASYKGNRSQVIIRNSNDARYFVNKDHPEHGKWKQDHDPKNKTKHDNKGNSGKKGKHKNR